MVFTGAVTGAIAIVAESLLLFVTACDTGSSTQNKTVILPTTIAV